MYLLTLNRSRLFLCFSIYSLKQSKVISPKNTPLISLSYFLLLVSSDDDFVMHSNERRSNDLSAKVSLLKGVSSLPFSQFEWILSMHGVDNTRIHLIFAKTHTPSVPSLVPLGQSAKQEYSVFSVLQLLSVLERVHVVKKESGCVLWQKQ